MLKVVVDANIWISALLNSQKALAVVRLLERDEFQLVCAEALINELAEVLDRPKFQTKIQHARKESLLKLVREKAVFYELPENWPVPQAVEKKVFYDHIRERPVFIFHLLRCFIT